MWVLLQVLLTLLVWSGGPAVAQEARGGATPGVFAELRSLDATLAEVCRTGAQRLDDAAWAAWKRRQELIEGFDAGLRGRLLRLSRLEPECRTRLAALAQQRAAAAVTRPYQHGYRQRPAPPSIAVERPRPEPPSTSVDPERRQAPVAAEANEPLFPWPPPTPSTSRAFSPDVAVDKPRARTAGEVADRLRAIAVAAGYPDYKYYLVPGGFAFVTRIESLDGDTGRPLPDDTRWPSRAVMASAVFSVWDMFRVVRTPGYHRLFMFVLTDKPVETRPVDGEEAYRLAEAWTLRGSDFLDRENRARPVTPDHALLVLVYEFERTDEKSKHLRPSRWPLDDHLESIGASLKSLP